MHVHRVSGHLRVLPVMVYIIIGVRVLESLHIITLVYTILYTAQNNWARFDTDCRKVSNRGQGGARIEHVRPLRPRTDTGVTC